ncbi:MAG: hypothetical protein ABI334_06010 [Candidatus Dormiibacterota bacterium]
MDLATRQAAKAATRDDAMQRLRDLTIAVAIAACGAVGLLAWISAATIPGIASSGQPASNDSQFTPTFTNDDGSQQPSYVAPASSGSGFAVSGGSHSH